MVFVLVMALMVTMDIYNIHNMYIPPILMSYPEYARDFCKKSVFDDIYMQEIGELPDIQTNPSYIFINIGADCWEFSGLTCGAGSDGIFEGFFARHESIGNGNGIGIWDSSLFLLNGYGLGYAKGRSYEYEF